MPDANQERSASGGKMCWSARPQIPAGNGGQAAGSRSFIRRPSWAPSIEFELRERTKPAANGTHRKATSTVHEEGDGAEEEADVVHFHGDGPANAGVLLSAPRGCGRRGLDADDVACVERRLADVTEGV